MDTTGSTPPKRVVRNLPSLAVDPGVGAAEGVFDVAFGPFGQMFILAGLGGDPAARDDLGKAGRFFGTVHWVTPFGWLVPVGDISGHEQRRNPAGGAIDSNPYGLAAFLFRRVVADAGGNSLVQAFADGRTRTLAVFPEQLAPAPFPPNPLIPSQPVPTCVVEGPDGFLYVGSTYRLSVPRRQGECLPRPARRRHARGLRDGFHQHRRHRVRPQAARCTFSRSSRMDCLRGHRGGSSGSHPTAYAPRWPTGSSCRAVSPSARTEPST